MEAEAEAKRQADDAAAADLALKAAQKLARNKKVLSPGSAQGKALTLPVPFRLGIVVASVVIAITAMAQ